MTPPSRSNRSSDITTEQSIKNALTSFKNNKLSLAMDQFLTILKDQKNHPEANYYMGLLTLKKNRPAESLQYLQIALDQQPNHGPYWLAYIEALAQSGQPDIARDTLIIAQQAGLEGEAVNSLATRLGIQQEPSIKQISSKTSHSEFQEPNSTDTLNPDQKLIDQLISLYQQNKFSDCIDLARSTLSKFPEHGFLWTILGACLNQQGQLEDAISAMRKATKFLPDDPQTYNNLGVTLKTYGALKESESILRHALRIKNNFAEAQNNLGVTLWAQGKLLEGEECFRKAIHMQPDYVEAHCNLGINLKDQRRYLDAEHSLKHTLRLSPTHTEALNSLGNLYQGMNRLSDAETIFNEALKIKPDFAKVHYNLGNVRQDQGNLQASEQHYQEALKCKPSYSDAFDGLLFVSNYHADKSADEIFALYQEYDRQFGIPHHTEWQTHQNNRSPDRRLKLGYVSPSFYDHPVFKFMEPLLVNHDKNKFEIYAYAEVKREDQATLNCKQHVDHWISTIGMSDEALVKHIRSDKIDILIDLAGHTGLNKLAVFARKPAPVSLHWLDFGYTTGLTSVDYYLTDLQTGPIGSEHLFSEQLWRLPAPPLTYRPAKGMGQVSPLPASHRGYITFGTLTRAIRLNRHTINAWVELLKRVENSRLVVDSNNFKDPVMQESLRNQFVSQGIDPKRLDIGYHSPPWDIIRDIDIGLDCFPHNSGTTLFENLYMGVPFITYAHRPGVGRIGSSILSGINRYEWIAHSQEEYVEKLVTLASDIPGLVKIRTTLRKEMQNSPLMDEQGFTITVENAYLAMFKKWAKTIAPGSFSSNIHAQAEFPAPTPIATDAATFYNLGIDHQMNGRTDEAETAYIQAVNIQPDFVDAYNNLGVVFQQKKQYADAENSLALALQFRPDYTDAQFNLANTFKLKPDLLKAEENYRKVIELQPDYTNAHYNLGDVLQQQGRPEEAEKSLKHAIELTPDHINAFSTLLFTLNYHPDKSSEEIFASYREYNKRFCVPFHDSWISHSNSRDPNRCLKVGYVAPSYRKHPARYFIEPLLAHQNKKSIQTFAYIDVAEENGADDLFHPYVDHWISSKNMTDQELNDIIRRHEIDVLVDLAGHTAGNRLQVFARRPAPVSLHWLDFGYTTGLTAIDYYLTDTITVPPGNQDYFSETLFNIETPALAYRPPKKTGPVNTLPAHQNKYITFGTLTRAIRINYKTIRVWAEILKKVTDSKLIINSGSFTDPAMQETVACKFLEHGITRDRLEIGCQTPPWNVLRRIDIMLDCFPHNSGTTLIESLYMGVPYITLADRPSVGRLGSSILASIEHQELIATTEDEYINLAVSLSADLSRLNQLRKNLRQEMQASPLMAEEPFAQKMEKAYRDMFRKWANQEDVTETISPQELIKKGLQQALQCMQAKLSSEAHELYLSILTIDPGNSEANFNLGLLLLEQHEPVSALPYLESAVNSHPEHRAYWLTYIDAMNQAGQRDTACQLLEMAIQAGLEGEETEILKKQLLWKGGEN